MNPAHEVILSCRSKGSGHFCRKYIQFSCQKTNCVTVAMYIDLNSEIKYLALVRIWQERILR